MIRNQTIRHSESQNSSNTTEQLKCLDHRVQCSVLQKYSFSRWYNLTTKSKAICDRNLSTFVYICGFVLVEGVVNR